MIDATAEFLTTCEDQGLRPERIIGDGELHRCPVEGKAHGLDGAYVLHQDPPASGWWKNYRTGNEDTWTTASGNDPSISPEDRARLRARIKADQEAQREAQAKHHAEAAAEAASILTEAPGCPIDHPYLKAKAVPAYPGLKLSRDGRIIVPVLDATGKPVSLQFIADNGEKRFLTGGRVAGGFFAIKGNDGPLYIAEGYATAATIHEATGATVLAAFNAGNLLAVAKLARTMYPERPIILGADDDLHTDGNPGVTKATEAAQAINGVVVVPRLPDGAEGSDFNDLASVVGLDKVKDQLIQRQESDKGMDQESVIEVITASDILDMTFPDKPLIGGLLDERESLLVCGPSGLGKSILTFNLALTLAIAPANGLWGLFPLPRPLRTVFMQSENSGKAMQARLRSITDAAPELRPGLDGLFFPRIGDDCRASGMLGDDSFRARILGVLTAVRADILVLDPLISFHGADENDNAAMRRSLDALTAICDAANVACVVVHHVGKSGSDNAVFAGRGASAIGDWAANILLMNPVLDDEGNRTSIIEMKHMKARNFETASPFFLDRRPELTMLRVEDPRDGESRERAEAVVDCLRKMGGKARSKLALENALVESMGVGRTTAQRAINDARRRGEIRFFENGGRSKGVVLPTLPKNEAAIQCSIITGN
ncbi:AAA family ATPase [Desulfocurvus sp. DL9XJH121]